MVTKRLIPPVHNSFDFLSHLRWIAALVVVLSHIHQDVLLEKGFVPEHNVIPTGLVAKHLFRLEGFGHAAVVVFFVLSGFLVGGKLIDLVKSSDIHKAWPKFLADRVARIFVVLWPALLLSGIVFVGLMLFAPEAPFVKSGNWAFDLIGPISDDSHFSRWAGVAVLLNEFIVPTAQTNSALWSLAYEWFYYIFGLAAVLTFRRVFSAGALLVIFYGAALMMLSLLNQADVAFSGLLWLCGVAARIVFNHAVLHGVSSRLAGIAAVLAVLVMDKFHPLPDIALGAALALMLAHVAWGQWHFFGVLGERLAGFSYSLYTTHFPVMLASMGILYRLGYLPHPLPRNKFALALSVLVLVNTIVVARVFAYFTEDRTRIVRDALLALGSRRALLKTRSALE